MGQLYRRRRATRKPPPDSGIDLDLRELGYPVRLPEAIVEEFPTAEFRDYARFSPMLNVRLRFGDRPIGPGDLVVVTNPRGERSLRAVKTVQARESMLEGKLIVSSRCIDERDIVRHVPTWLILKTQWKRQAQAA